jgi:hypothetical protein
MEKCRWNCDEDGVVFLADKTGRRIIYRCRCPKGAKHPEAWYRAHDKDRQHPIAFPLVPFYASETPPARIGRELAAGKDD